MPPIRVMFEPGSTIDRIATFLLANLMWFFFAAFILPLPAATGAIFAVFLPWARGKDVELFSTFFGTLWHQLRKSTIVGVIDIFIALLVYTNLTITGEMGDEIFVWVIRGFNMSLLVALGIVNIYVWPLLVLFDLPIKRLLNVSVRLAFGHIFWSILVLFLGFVVLSLLIYIPLIGFFTAPSGVALTLSWGAWRIIQRYASPEELAELDLH